MNSEAPPAPKGVIRLAEGLMAASLGVMAVAVFINVVLRYGCGSGINASEELSRLLFVWMVFIGATVAYAAGEHIAFTSLLLPLRHKPVALRAMSRFIHLLVITATALVAWGAWQQVVVGMGSNSAVIGYSMALLPLPAFLCAGTIAVLATIKLVRGEVIALQHDAETE